MKLKWIVLVIIAFLTSGVLYYQHDKYARESIIFFPIDETVTFNNASTSLHFIKNEDDDEYVLEWEVSSVTNQLIFLRQDISMLFMDGKLLDTSSEWEDQSQKLAQFKKIHGEDSSHYQAISLHYGEIHQKNGLIKSSQKISSDHLYVIDSEFTESFSFKEAQTEEEIEWREILDKVTEQHLRYTWNNLITFYGIDRNKYHELPLIDIDKGNLAVRLGVSERQAQEVIGLLWEQLYKNYFIGIKTKEDTVLPPIGSTMPLILISKDLSHLSVLSQSKNGEPVKITKAIEITE